MLRGRTVSGLAIGLAWALAFGSSATVKARSVLDGQTFVGESGEKGKAKGNREEIVFKDGTFRSVPCDAYGFGAAAYTVIPATGATAFEVTTTSPKEGEIEWKGTVKADQLSGSFVWKKKGQADIEYWVKAKRVQQ
jgi:hypothetical protein